MEAQDKTMREENATSQNEPHETTHGNAGAGQMRRTRDTACHLDLDRVGVETLYMTLAGSGS